jgi:hypothetical protein
MAITNTIAFVTLNKTIRTFLRLYIWTGLVIPLRFLCKFGQKQFGTHFERQGIMQVHLHQSVVPPFAFAQKRGLKFQIELGVKLRPFGINQCKVRIS